MGEDGAVLNDYQHNIHVLAASGMIEFRSAGYACSIVGSYMREFDLFPKKEDRKISNHVGAVGDKLDIDVEYKNSFYKNMPTGGFYIHKFISAEGNVLVWMTSTSIHADVGTKLKLRGTVKSHGEFKGEKNTMVTRCKVITI